MVHSKRKGTAVELSVAKMFGVARNKSDGTSHCDIHTDTLAIEVKARASLPDWIHKAMGQAVADSRGKMPLVVLVEQRRGTPTVRYALLRLEDYIEREI